MIKKQFPIFSSLIANFLPWALLHINVQFNCLVGSFIFSFLSAFFIHLLEYTHPYIYEISLLFSFPTPISGSQDLVSLYMYLSKGVDQNAFLTPDMQNLNTNVITNEHKCRHGGDSQVNIFVYVSLTFAVTFRNMGVTSEVQSKCRHEHRNQCGVTTVLVNEPISLLCWGCVLKNGPHFLLHRYMSVSVLPLN